MNNGIKMGFLVLLFALNPACSHTQESNGALRRLATAKSSTPADASAELIDAELVDLDGHHVGSESDTTIKALVVVFILADCPICNSYVAELNRLFESFNSREIRIVLVHADSTMTVDEARQHAREYQIQAPIALDPHHQWVKKAGATVAPEAAVFSPTGEVLYRGRINDQYAELGKRRTTISSHDLRDVLDAIVAGRPVAVTTTQAIGCFIPGLARVP